MFKKKYLHFTIVFLIIIPIFFIFLFKNIKSGKTATTPQPNIIFILADDLDLNLGSLDYMPKLKQYLTNQGISFSSYFVSISLCCPSRTTFLRGQYSHNTQVLGNIPPSGGFQRFYSLGEETSTIATWLQSAGYKTVLLGKYLNGYAKTAPNTYIPPGWNEWYAISGNLMYYKYTLNENGILKYYGTTPADYQTDVLSSKSADFIQRSVSDSRPFFMFIAPYAPHAIAKPAPRHKNLFPTAQAPRTPSFNEADVSDKPKWVQSLPLLTDTEIATIDARFRSRIQTLQAVDDLIENVVNTLQTTGKLDNTYIFFSSDNGFHLGQHRQDKGKNTGYEEDIKLPLIVRGPGVTAGKVVDELAGNVDLAQTFAELAGTTVPSFVDGRSLVPFIIAGSPTPSTWRQGFNLESGLEKSTVVIPTFTAIRTKKEYYVEYDNGEREYYNLLTDPYELVNTYSTTDPALISSLSAMIRALKTCTGDSCRTAESQPLATPTPTSTPTPTP